jgi:hypothetical protein
MAVRITKTDIDCLIDVTQLLKSLAESATDTTSGGKLMTQAHRVRKVYMMLLHANEYGQTTLKDICERGLSTHSNIGIAIDTMCPLAKN